MKRIKGGSRYNDIEVIRSAYRAAYPTDFAGDCLGFRFLAKRRTK